MSDAMVPTSLDALFERLEGIDTAMLTTRRPDGHLVSRAMATQKATEGADLWFVTATDSSKLNEIAFDPHVNLAYWKTSREWLSVAGKAFVTRDRVTIANLYEPDWKIWFPDTPDGKGGTADDPRIALIGVEIHSAVFLEVDKPAPLVLFEIAKGLLTDKPAELGEMHRVDRPKEGPSAGT
jgi:general stress protein 26